MKVLVIGSGGREHALAWRLAQSARVDEVLVAPGNAGTATEPKLTNVNLSAHEDLMQLVRDQNVAFTLVGPEAPLAAGIVDDFRAAGLKIFGPTQYAAQLESSKDFAKAFMAKYNIPTAGYQTFSDAAEAHAYIAAKGAPIVIKADGLAAGKGVIVAMSDDEAHAAIDDMLVGNKMGDAGARVVIEDFLTGEEASFIVMVDGEHVLAMATSQDHKRLLDGDQGPNTGGMGAYSPAPVVTDAVYQRVMDEIIYPTVRGMQAEGHPFSGFLYAGLMIDGNDDPYVIEFNCRFGDPETQPIMMRLKGSMVDLIQAGLDGKLPEQTEWDSRPALGIVLASKGYPETASTGDVIHGLAAFDSQQQTTVKVFHAGTTVNAQGDIVTSGGRVLCVTALGDDILAAQTHALAACDHIDFEGMQYRRDIGYRAIGRNK